MQNKGKNWFLKKINAYFIFTALIIFLGVYFVLLDNWGGYQAKIDILLLPKNEKTAIQVDKIRENIVILAQKNEIVDEKLIFKIEEADSIIGLKLNGDSQLETTKAINQSTRNIIDITSKYYDIKNDLSLEIVFSKVLKNETSGFVLVSISLLVGIGLSLVVQMLLDFVENIILSSVKRKKVKNKDSSVSGDFKDLFKINREKIEKLSASFVGEVKKEDERDKILEKSFVFKNQDLASKEDIIYPAEEIAVNFKKAASPDNLPIDQADFGSSYKKNILDNFSNTKDEVANIVEVDNVTKEPSEEDFKRRLNQLLGNKMDA